MKRGIEIWPDYDRNGIWCLKVKKKKGKLSVEELREAAKEYDGGYYFLLMNCTYDDEPQFEENDQGDFAIIYSTDNWEVKK